MRRSRQLHLHIVGGLDWEPTKQKHNKLFWLGSAKARFKAPRQQPKQRLTHLKWTHACRRTMVNTMFHSAAALSARRVWQTSRWFVGLYFEPADFKPDLLNNIHITFFFCSLIFIENLIAAIQNNSLFLHSVGALGSDVHNLMMQLSPPAVSSHHMILAITCLSLVCRRLQAAHNNSSQSLAITRFPGLLCCYLPDIFYWTSSFKCIDWMHFLYQECERRCDCFGDGAAAEAVFLQDACVCEADGERFTAYWCDDWSVFNVK